MNAPDPLSRPTLFLEVFAGGEKPISKATGFLIHCRNQYFIATNYHVVSGRHPKSDELLGGVVPQKLRIHHRSLDNHSYHGGIELVDEPLVNLDQKPCWHSHPNKSLSRHEDARLAIDLALLPLTNTQKIVNQYAYLWQGLVTEPYVEVGSEVSVVGYPLGYSGLVSFPVWKCAHIASEIHAHPDQKHFLIDCPSREGMSGAPVVRRNSGGSFLGIYSGRMFDDTEFGIGIVWRWHLLHELLELHFGEKLFRK